MASLARRICQHIGYALPLTKKSCFMGICLLALCTGLQAQEPSAHLSVTQRTLAVTSLVDPFGVAVDQSGDLYVADEYSGTVAEVQLNGDVYLDPVTVLQGLSWPSGLAVDAQGNLYITEDGNTNDVIKETAASTPAGTVYTRSVIPASGLGVPAGIAVDPIGNVYIADSANNRILKETPSGESYTQRVIPSGALSSPYGVAVDAGGDVLIADWGHNRVLKETISGSSYTESVVTANTVNNPVGVSVDASGNIYVLNFVDQETSSLLKETPSQGSYVQSAVAFAPDLNAEAIAADGSGNIYIAAPGTHGLQKFVTGAGDFGQVGVLGPSLPVSVVFTFDQAGTIGTPAVLTQGASGLDFLDVGNVGGRCGGQGPGFVYNVGDSCVVGVLFDPITSGARYGAVALRDAAGKPVALGYVYGVGLGGQVGFPPGVEANIDSPLAQPMGVAVDAGGNIYVAESATGKVYKETSSSGPASRTILAQGLSNPAGVAVDGAGNIYISAANAVYKEMPVPGGYAQSEMVPGLDHLAGIAVDANGNLYLISSTSGDVHKETLAAGGTYTETSIGAGIANPTGVAVDSSGNIFVADARQGELYEEALRADGAYAQSVIATGLNAPAGIAVDGGAPLALQARAHLYVTASGAGVVYEFFEQADGTYLPGMEFAVPSTPWGIAVDGRKNLYITRNVGDGAIIKIDVTDPPALSFATTRAGSVSADQTVTVANVGNSGLFISPLRSGAQPSLSTGFGLSSETTCPNAGDDPVTNPSLLLLANESCIYAIDFAPQMHANYKGALVITDDNLGINLAQQSISLSGPGVTSDTTRTTMRISPNPVKVGLGVTMSVTVTDTTNAASVPIGGVTVTDTVGNVITSLNGGVPVPLSGGKAVLTMTPSVSGTHTITAHYNGVDAGFAGSTIETDLSVQP
jgi:sugar lactone lactonase YvrE